MKTEPTLESVKTYLNKRIDAAEHKQVKAYYHMGYITVIVHTHPALQNNVPPWQKG